MAVPQPEVEHLCLLQSLKKKTEIKQPKKDKGRFSTLNRASTYTGVS